MSNLVPLIVAHLRNSYRLKGAVFVMVSMTVLLIAGLIALVCVLAIVPETRSASPNEAKVARYLGLIVYGSGLLAMGMNLNVFTANNLVKEKAQRLFESLLAAPVGICQLWMAKSLAVFLPGLVLCEAFAIASLLGVNALIIVPRMGFLASPTMILNGLALVPLLYFPICGLVILVGLAANPILGNVIANITVQIVATLVANLVIHTRLDPGSFLFTMVHLALAVALGLVVLALWPRLTKERVVLSCKA
jgi:ABC-type Na+ efflux pump permease subunit